MTTNGVPVSPRPNRTSWYSITSPRSSVGGEGSSLPAVEIEEADINDAFEEEDLAVTPSFTQNTLKRESLGGEKDLGDVLASDGANAPSETVGEQPSDGGLSSGMVDIVLSDPAQSPSRNSPDHHEPKPRPMTLKRPALDDIQISPASPITPSIVLSRPPSTPADDDVPSNFVDVSLAQDNSPAKQPSPTRAIPKPIIVPPANVMTPNVQIVQGPNTPLPGSPLPGSRNSTSSPQPNGGPKPQLPGSASLPAAAGPSSVAATTHRPSRSKGISTQDVVSKTRPSHLPPKSKEEDLRHMKVWEEMMQKSRLAGNVS